VSVAPESGRRWRIELPPDLPPGNTVTVPGRGEVFVRDSGGDGPPVLLLHGWTVSADLNWEPSYGALVQAGYRVIAVDHRGHGRGLRTPAPFRLIDCAADAAGALRTIGCGPAIAVGYSMGGPIAALTARDHSEVVSGVVLCATACHWREARLRLFWRTMGLLRLSVSLFPLQTWRWALRRWGYPDGPRTTWAASELARGSARDLAEAGRELSRFDSRPWIGRLPQPVAVVLTTRDTAVPPRKQRELAAASRAPVFEVASDHFAPSAAKQAFNAALLRALDAVQPRAAAGADAVSARAGSA
jgi:pimeloyl-ACP methyl ester carboxylesterase